MSDVVSGAQEYQLAGDDVVVPFAVEELDIRGRVIQTGDLVDTILKRHDYPQDVSLLLGELIVLTILLGSSLKFEGNFILQTQSDGPVSLAVVDFVTPGTVRAYARFDEDAIKVFSHIKARQIMYSNASKRLDFLRFRHAMKDVEHAPGLKTT